MNAQITLSDFLAHLWRGGEAYLWTTEGEKSLAVVGGALPSIPADWRNVYFGVNASRKPKRAKNEDITAINCLYVDLDAKDQAFGYDKGAISAHIDALWNHGDGLPYPTVIVDSGGGYHCYWLLETTVTVDDGNRERLRAVQAGWVKLWGGDNSAKDLARILRLPTTKNHKYTPPRPVQIIESDNRRLYQFEELAALALAGADSPSTPEQSTPIIAAAVGGNYYTKAVEDELNKLARTPEGQRNDALNRSAYKLGGYAAHLDEADVIDKLENVGIALGLPVAEAVKTVCSGWDAGKAKERLPALKNGKSHQTPPTPADPDLDADDAAEMLEQDRRLIKNPEKFAARDGWAFPYRWDLYQPQDGGIADAFRDLPESADWRFVRDREQWFHWNGQHWQDNECLALAGCVASLMESLNKQAAAGLQQARQDMADAKAQKNDDAASEASALAEFAAAMRSATKRTAGRISSVTTLLSPWLAVAPTALDSGNLLNLANGTLHLDNFRFAAHDRADLLTFCLPYEYNPDADCPRWRQFVTEVLVDDDGKHDPELAGLFQELFGLSLTEDTSHEAMAWLSGEGSNGKSTALVVLREMLGTLAVNVNFHTLGASGDYQLAGLPGRRVIVSSESLKGGGAPEHYLKNLVSGESLTARPIYGKQFEFRPVAKLWWAMNDRPIVKDTSDAIWRRLQLIEFKRKFEGDQKDIHLSTKLRAELPGILNWALAGLKRLRLRGRLPESKAVKTAIADYRRETNQVAQWLDECVKVDGKLTDPVRAQTVYDHYKWWAKDNGREVFNSTNFGREVGRILEKNNTRWAKARNEKGVAYHFVLLSHFPDANTDDSPPRTHTDAKAMGL